MNKISVIVSVYNEEDNIEIFYEELSNNLNQNKIPYEIIFVDDGSKDNSKMIIKKITKKDNNVKYIFLSRNFGKDRALMSGLKLSNGDYACIMDVDLQDPPNMLIEMYEELEKNKDLDCITLVSTSNDGYGLIRKIFTKVYYKIIKNITNSLEIGGERDFRLMRRNMIESILECNEVNRYSKGIFSYVGYNIKYIKYKKQARKRGKSKFNFIKLTMLALEDIFYYFDKPLIKYIIVSLILSIILLILCIIFIFIDINTKFLILTLLLFFISFIIFLFNIILYNIIHINQEIKDRPYYIIKETNIK